MIFVYRNFDTTNRFFDFNEFSYSPVWITLQTVLINTSGAGYFIPQLSLMGVGL